MIGNRELEVYKSFFIAFIIAHTIRTIDINYRMTACKIK